MLKPGTYPARMVGVDFGPGPDFMAMAFAAMARDGAVMIEHCIRLERGSGKASFLRTIHSAHDYMDFTKDPNPSRSQRTRHYKARNQPNRGPRSFNPW